MCTNRRRVMFAMAMAAGLAFMGGPALAEDQADAAKAPAPAAEKPFTPASQADVARTAEAVGHANAALRQAAAELERLQAAEAAASLRYAAAREAYRQADAAFSRAYEASLKADADATEAGQNLLFVAQLGDADGEVAQARMEVERAKAAATRAAAALAQANAFRNEADRVCQQAVAANNRAEAAAADARYSVSQAQSTVESATKAYNAARLALAKTDLKAGEDALKAGKLPLAAGLLAGAAQTAPGVDGAEAVAGQAQKGLETLEDLAARKFTLAKDNMAQGNYSEALLLLTQVVEKFPATRSAPEARRLLAADQHLVATALLLAAEKLDAAGEAAEAVVKYLELMRVQPESAQALKARLRLEAMERGDATASAVRDGRERAMKADCSAWLRMAENYVSNNRPDQARLYLDKVTSAYPDSDYARQAQQMLAKMPAVASH